MSEDDRNRYKTKIAEYINYDYDKNKMDIPDAYDCADVSTYLYDNGMKETSLGSQIQNLKANGSPLENIPDISSKDFFENGENITFYEDRSFNNPYIEIGSVAVWKNDGKTGWVGHIATIVDVQRDVEGNVLSIVTIEGHLGKKTKVDFTNTSQAAWDSYKGEFLGFGELGKDSIEKYPMTTESIQ